MEITDLEYAYYNKISNMTYDNLTEDNKKLHDKDEEICCHICCNIMIRPIEHNLCGKLMCSMCFEKMYENNDKCPFCKQEMSEDNIFHSKRLQSKINNMLVICPNENCKNELIYGKLLHHFKNECLYETIKCHKCDDIMFRHDNIKHEQEYCIKRQITCNYCKINFTHDIINKHKEECTAKPIICPYKCGQVILANDLDIHSSICPEKLVTCPLKGLTNCNHECKIIDLETHLHDIMSHFIKSLEVIKKQKSDIISLEDKILEQNLSLCEKNKETLLYITKEEQYKNELKLKNDILHEIKNDIKTYKNHSFMLAKDERYVSCKKIINIYKYFTINNPSSSGSQ